MKVILTENIEALGNAGTVKEVANGYARNYLRHTLIPLLESLQPGAPRRQRRPRSARHGRPSGRHYRLYLREER